MARDIESLVVQFSADFKRLENAINKQNGQFNRQMKRMENSADASVRRINNALGNIGKGTLGNIAAPLTGITAALGTRELMHYADAWTQAGNLIRASATAAGVGARSINELKDGANDARTSLETYTELYARIIRSASGVAKSEEEVALATNLVAKAMKAGGASAQEQQASLIQLGQALGSGVLQGDELRSLRENAPVIAKAIADEFGVTIAGLKKLGSEGKLTSDRVFRAIINAQKPIEAQFKATNSTIADAFTRINNEFTAYIGNADKSAGASATLVQSLQFVAENFKEIADVIATFATILIAAFTGRAIGGMIVGLGQAVVALGTFLTALRTGTGVAIAFSAALGPIGLLAGAAAAAVYLLYNNMDSGDRAAKSFSDAVEGNKTALENAASASRQYQTELVKQISLQLQAAESAYEMAKADSFIADQRRQRFTAMTGLKFAPLEYAADQAFDEAQRLAQAADKLEEQKKRAEKILSSTPTGFGGGVPTDPDDKKKKKGRTKKTPEERFEDDIRRITDRTAALVAETEAQRQVNPLIDDYGYAMEKARTEQELLNAAQRAGVEITPALRKEIAATAEQWALASAEAAKLAEEQDKIRQRAEEWQDVSKDAMRGIVDDLINGKSAADAFANALGKIADKLLDMAFDDLFTGLFKGSGGGGFFGKLLGFSGGGYTGSGGKYEPKGIVHAGEVVWSQDDVRNAGGVGVVEAMRRGVAGYAGGGAPGMIMPPAPTMPVLSPQRQSSTGGSMRVDVGVSVDEKGNLQAYVRDVSRQESASTVKAYDKSGPMRFARDSKQATRRGLVR